MITLPAKQEVLYLHSTQVLCRQESLAVCVNQQRKYVWMNKEQNYELHLCHAQKRGKSL